jgi:ABC-2 type transport system ATP-binding protein
MLELRSLTRRYGDVVALDDLWFTVGDGQMFRFVGPNGAGKTPPWTSSSACWSLTPAKCDGADTDDGQEVQTRRTHGPGPRTNVFYAVRQRSTREGTRCLSYEG